MKQFKLKENVGSFEAVDGKLRVKVAAGEVFTPATEAEAALVTAHADYFEEVKESPKASKKTEEVKD